MRILVLGGTAMLGWATARQATSAGHEVVCLARGESGAVPADVRLVVGDRDQPTGLAPVADERWDVVIDVSRQPGQVRHALDTLTARHWVFVSTISVYADHATRGQNETSTPLVQALGAETMESDEEYAPAKVACEQAVREAVGEQAATIVRAGLIGGQDDGSDRSPYWPWRMANPAVSNRVLVPDVSDQPVQIIDVRDLAAFLVHTGTERIGGTFDASGELTTLGETLLVCQEVAGTASELVPADQQWLAEQGVGYWAGPRSLPLWLPDEAAGLMDRDLSAARAAGLLTRPLDELFAAALHFARSRPADHQWRSGLSDEQERELLGAMPA